jgi:hypothetical protein
MTFAYTPFSQMTQDTMFRLGVGGWSIVYVLLALAMFAGQANATALTTYLQGNEKSCFYADVDGQSRCPLLNVQKLELDAWLSVRRELISHRNWRESRQVRAKTRQANNFANGFVITAAGFYFSVQSGGSFDIDYTVQDPAQKVLLEGTGERQGDYIFTANSVSYQSMLCSGGLA